MDPIEEARREVSCFYKLCLLLSLELRCKLIAAEHTFVSLSNIITIDFI